MNQPPQAPAASSGWILLAGVLLGGALLAFMAWDSFSSKKSSAPISAHVIELNEDNWQKEVVESKVPVLVDFTAPWCIYCREQAPIIDRLAERYAGKIKVGTVNLGKNPDARENAALCDKYGIGPIPHLLIMNGGEKPFASLVGLQSEAKLASALNTALAKN
jgi:thioredoxin 1